MLEKMLLRSNISMCSSKPGPTTEQELKEFKVLEESIKKSLDKHPALSAEMSKETLNRERTPSSTIPPSTEAMIDFTNLTLSRENILIDTHALVKAFQQANFTPTQSECITYTLTQIMNEALREQRKMCVEKAALDVMREQMMSHIGAMRKDMTILEKSELSDLRNENEKLKLLLSQHKSMMTEDVSRVRNQLTLDMNMERSRAKDDQSSTEMNISKLTTKMTAEVGRLETMFEKYKNDIYKFIIGAIGTVLTLGLGYYRVVKN